MDEVVDILISFDDGKLVIERKDGEPISVITHSQDEECVEVLEFGCAGNAVKALQALLNCNGQHLEVDGVFGRLTQTALQIFQNKVGLAENGTCTKSVWEKLIMG